jgi:ParB/Sulfiredoxin domain
VAAGFTGTGQLPLLRGLSPYSQYSELRPRGEPICLLTNEIGNWYSVGSMITLPSTEIQTWPIEKLVFYARKPRRNDAAVDRMCIIIREFGCKIPVLVRSDSEVVDGHLRLKAARKLRTWPGGDTTKIPVILCD